MIKKSLTLSAIATAFAATAANAADYDYQFRFQPQELQTERGAEAVYSRVRLTAEQTCLAGGRRPLAWQADKKTCIADITDDLVGKIDDARLSALHARASGASRYSSAS